MKVCLASLAPFLGGAEVALERLALGLKKLEVEVVCVLGSKNEVADRYERVGLSLIYLSMPFTDKMKWPHYLVAKYNFRKFLEKEKVDILHCNDLPSFQLPGAAAKPLGIPRICHHRYIFNGEAIKWFLKPGADYHVFVSKALKRDLEKHYPPLAKQFGEVNYDGLLLPEIVDENQRLALRNKFGLPLNRVIVLFAGQIIPRKGVQDLIKAWSLLSQKVLTQAYLVLIGEDLSRNGTYRRKMELLAQNSRIQADFRGFQKNVDEWLDVADIVVVPSHIEPLGNATLEAMAHAKPVIGSNVGGIPEMISHQETGLLVESQNPKTLSAAIEFLVNNHELRTKMGKLAQKKIENKFSLDGHVKKMVNLYERLLCKRNG